MFAAHHGHKVLVEPLLDSGANMYICDRVSCGHVNRNLGNARMKSGPPHNHPTISVWSALRTMQRLSVHLWPDMVPVAYLGLRVARMCALVR